MFDILGLIPKEPFKDSEQPVSLPDEKIEDRKRNEALRAKELESARTQAIENGFEPRKIKTVDSQV
jgi:hypothetical protein